MENRFIAAHAKNVLPIKFGDQSFLYVKFDWVLITPFEITPTIGKYDYTKSEDCQKELVKITKALKGRFEGDKKRKGFPFCCQDYSNLVKIKEFDRAAYVNVPEMTAKKMIYTKQHILNNINSENWYKEIMDYIEWALQSFGQMPKDCGEPLYLSDYVHYVKDFLEKNEAIPQNKKSKILEFFESPSKKNNDTQTDFNVLIETYQRWLKIFPFEISFFAPLKPYFERHVPILGGKPEENKYAGFATVELHTKSSLIEFLMNVTNDLLTKINTLSLSEKGQLTEPQKIQLELIMSERRMKLKQGYINKSPNEEHRYRQILKMWFRDEKEFIDNIKESVKSEPQQTDEKTKTDNQENSTRQKIESAFSFMQSNDLRTHRQILNEKDYNNLIDWVTSYFENNFTIPSIDKPIQEINTGKRNVQWTFMKLYKDIHPASTRPNSLFELIKACFHQYREDKIGSMKKTNEPQYYKELIKGNQ